MIQVRFTTFERSGNDWIELPVAELVADGDDVTITGPHADWINPEISIVDPDTGLRASRVDDAEHWARLLPFAYRAGDITAEVTEVAIAQPASAAFHYRAEG